MKCSKSNLKRQNIDPRAKNINLKNPKEDHMFHWRYTPHVHINFG
jgi:hypothetical protein